MRFRVVSDSVYVGGIRAINLVTEKEAVTDEQGRFSLMVKDDDLVVLSSLNFEYTRKLIEEEDLALDEIRIKMIPKATPLETVNVNAHPEINAVSLGILSKPAKQYTPAERRLATAGDFKWWHLVGILGGNLPIDPIINAISGRTKMLKKEVVAERKEALMNRLKTMYQEKYFTKDLGIPQEYVGGFLYYAVEKKALQEAMKTKNRTKISFVLSDIATQYKYVIKEVIQE